MNDDLYQKVAYIGLRNKDGTYQMNVPLYVKVNEVNKNGVTDAQEEIIHKISSILIEHYEKQIGEFLAQQKHGGTDDAEIQG